MPVTPDSATRDPRVDLLRGIALLMIFIDHIPDNRLGYLTMRNFGFADAAELFVVFAGFSAMAAYGRTFERAGARAGIVKVLMRCLKLYEVQVGLLIVTLCVVKLWTGLNGTQSLILGPMLKDGLSGALRGVTLEALPAYLDILPLYLVLLALFPLVYWGLRRSLAATVCVSALIYVSANVWHINLPNVVDTSVRGAWFFNPFAWQFIFVIGAALATVTTRDGELPWHPGIALACLAYLLFAMVAAAPWQLWPNDWAGGLPLEILGNNPKGYLTPLRLLNGVAVVYLALTSLTLRRFCGLMFLRPVIACGRHSLEVFALGSLMALFGRLAFRSLGTDWHIQLIVNAVGMVSMVALALTLDRRRRRAKARPEVAKDPYEPAQAQLSYAPHVPRRPKLQAPL